MSSASAGHEKLDVTERTSRLYGFLFAVATADRWWDGCYYQGHTSEQLARPDGANHMLAWSVPDIWGVRTLQIKVTNDHVEGSRIALRYDSKAPDRPDWGTGTELSLYRNEQRAPDTQIVTNEPGEESTTILPPAATPRLGELLDRVEPMLLQVLGRYGITSFDTTAI